MPNTTDKSVLEAHLKHSELFLILDLQIFGFLQKSVNSHPPATSTDTLIAPRAQLTKPTELSLTSLMDQELSLDSLDKMLLL